MSSQGGNNKTNNMNSSSISGWFFGNQDKSTGNGFSSGISNVGGGGGSNTSSGNVGVGNGSNLSSGNPCNGFMSISKNTQDWQSGRNVNIWMPQSM